MRCRDPWLFMETVVPTGAVTREVLCLQALCQNCNSSVLLADALSPMSDSMEKFLLMDSGDGSHSWQRSTGRRSALPLAAFCGGVVLLAAASWGQKPKSIPSGSGRSKSALEVNSKPSTSPALRTQAPQSGKKVLDSPSTTARAGAVWTRKPAKTRPVPTFQMAETLVQPKSGKQAHKELITAKERAKKDKEEALLLVGAARGVCVLKRRMLKCIRTVNLYTTLALELVASFALSPQALNVEVDRALEKGITRAFHAGKSPQIANQLYYSVRWWFGLANVHLPLATLARRGFAKCCPTAFKVPITWPEVLLMCLSLVKNTASFLSLKARCLCAVGMLLAFDLYGRAQDLNKAVLEELRRPVRLGSPYWSLTLYPLVINGSPALGTSKTAKQDETILVGSMGTERRWIQRLLPAFLNATRATKSLLGVTSSEYQQAFHSSRKLSALPSAGLHQLRHGGASMDALVGCSIAEIQSRGRWTSPNSVVRYKRTAPYLRRLETLSVEQMQTVERAPTELCALIIEGLSESLSLAKRRRLKR